MTNNVILYSKASPAESSRSLLMISILRFGKLMSPKVCLWGSVKQELKAHFGLHFGSLVGVFLFLFSLSKAKINIAQYGKITGEE